MQKIKLKTEESGKKLLEAYAPPKWSETADDDDYNSHHTKGKPWDSLMKQVLKTSPSPPSPSS